MQINMEQLLKEQEEEFNEILAETFLNTNINSNGDLYLQYKMDDGESDAKQELLHIVNDWHKKSMKEVLEKLLDKSIYIGGVFNPTQFDVVKTSHIKSVIKKL